MKQNGSTAPKLAVSVTEAARLISVTDRYVRTLVYQGKLRGVRVGRRLLIPMDSLKQILEPTCTK